MKPLPAHLRANPARLRLLRAYSNGVRGLYGVPVYLCGSALLDFNEQPRDWDIRIKLSDADFARRYGPVFDWINEGASGKWGEARWRWSDDCVKRSKVGWLETRLLIDFQAYPTTHWNRGYQKLPRLRLDTRKAKP